jgi:CBS domain-containing protein
MELNDWLKDTSAGDIMMLDVVTLDTDDLLAEAATVLLHQGISGAPVIDEDGVCVGVLSVSDVVAADEKVAAEQEKIADSTFWKSDLVLPMHIYEERLAQVRDKLAPAAEQPVKRFMTANLVSARENTPLGTVVQHMVDAHVHRVVILDEQKKLRGIISTMDILAALLRASAVSRREE